MPPEPRLSVSLPSFSADDPGGWDHLVQYAVAADEAGVDRVVVSDHVAFGEHLDAYARPSSAGPPAADSRRGRTAPGSSRSPS